jgi:fatty acid desaturase
MRYIRKTQNPLTRRSIATSLHVFHNNAICCIIHFNVTKVAMLMMNVAILIMNIAILMMNVAILIMNIAILIMKVAILLTNVPILLINVPMLMMNVAMLMRLAELSQSSQKNEEQREFLRKFWLTSPNKIIMAPIDLVS